MNIQNKIALALGVAGTLAFASCISETPGIDEARQDKGTAVFDVQLKVPETRSVTEVTNFPVAVYDAEGTKVLSYNSVADIPAEVTMNVGNYKVEAHTPGNLAKRMDSPYYKGVEELEILKGVKSNVVVLCKMQNSKISVNYSDEFKLVFQSWEITVNDGSETALSFTNLDASNSVFWYFGADGAKELAVNFRGVTKDGNTVTYRTILTKNQANESYDDSEVFCGGDALTLNFTPTEDTNGNVTAVNINANLIFTETNEDVNVSVVDKPVEGSADGDGDKGDGDGSAIELRLPQNMVVSASTDPSLGDTYIGCANGIKSVMVKITSTSDDMISSLSDLNAGYGVDFVNGAEIVENTAMVNLFTDLGKTLTVPNSGDSSYTFPIGNFFTLLSVLPGAHTFDMVITDMNGNKKNGSLTLTVQ